MTLRFSNTAPTEEAILTFDFTNGLAAGETLAIATVVVAVDVGSDPDAAGIVAWSSVVDDTVQVAVADLVLNTDYRITVTCTTSNASKTLALAGILPCRRA